GSDTASYASASGGVSVNLADLTATGAAGNDVLVDFENATGSAFNDVLEGDNGNNRLDGGAGNDTLIATGGNDTLIGSGGIDTVDYLNATNGVNVDLTTGTATGLGTDTLSGVENVSGSNA